MKGLCSDPAYGPIGLSQKQLAIIAKYWIVYCTVYVTADYLVISDRCYLQLFLR